jgi:GNAT superfamily N-acetyltransferase
MARAMSYRFRLAEPSDAEALGAVVAEGFDTYRAFAPPGWAPPDPGEHVALLRAALGAPDVWCLVALADDGVAGHAAFLPASAAMMPADDPGLAHLWQIFVRPEHWGTGIARTLLARASAAARHRGFSTMRLFTPAGQHRARAFYERRGWSAGEPFDDARFGMPLVEYRVSLCADSSTRVNHG